MSATFPRHQEVPGKAWFRRMGLAARAPTRLQWSTIALLAMVVCAIWITVFALLDSYRKGAIDAQVRQNSNIARALQEQTLRVIAGVDQAVIRLAHMAAAGPVAPSEFQKQVDATGLSSDILTQLSLIDGQGRFVGSNIDPSGHATGPINLSDREHVSVHLAPPGALREHLAADGLFIGKPVLGKVSKKWTIQLSRPVLDAAGKSAGVVVASVDPRYFEEVYQHVRLGTGGGVSLVGADGVIRARVLGGVSSGMGAAVGSGGRVYRNALAQEGVMIGQGAIANAGRIAAYHQVSGYPLYVFTIASLQEALSEWSKARRLIVSLAALLSLAIVGAGGLFISGVRHLERQHRALQRSESDAQVANRAKTEFLAAISHELRTPLTSIRGFAELMERRGEDKRFREQASLIRKSSEHLNALLSEILDLSAVESGSMQFAQDQIVVRDLVEATVEIFQITAAAKSLDLQIRFAPDLPPTLEVDGFRLRQILNNLLSNAIKFTANGRVDVDVRIDAGFWTFAVTDMGPGIEPELHETVFEKFRQGHARVSYEHGGTGLGLALSRSLARSMGGDIRLRSAKGAGACFTLLLPATSRAQVDTAILEAHTH
ncbi:ATP-binding protein [uncultured Xylophilus sp.]|uniref:cache domain-containing sensor histidine kinase n=1 Tax=uncultured Xylophilus sp. TaxID=296832 RepID=UPI0025D31B1F|nr:ATP-binding protein [uncultured Xylophilus sp.]